MWVCRRLATVLLCLLALAGCGGGGGDDGKADRPTLTTPKAEPTTGRPRRRRSAGGGSKAKPPTGRSPTAEKAVVRGWADALRRGDVERAVRYWRVPAIASNGDQPYRLVTRAAVRRFNDGLTCGATLESVERDQAYVVATFRLPTAAACSGWRRTRPATFQVIIRTARSCTNRPVRKRSRPLAGGRIVGPCERLWGGFATRLDVLLPGPERRAAAAERRAERAIEARALPRRLYRRAPPRGPRGGAPPLARAVWASGAERAATRRRPLRMERAATRAPSGPSAARSSSACRRGHGSRPGRGRGRSRSSPPCRPSRRSRRCRSRPRRSPGRSRA